MSSSSNEVTVNKDVLTSLSIIVGAIIISIAIIFGLSNLNTSKGTTTTAAAANPSVAGATDTQAAAKPTVDIAKVKSLFGNGNITFGNQDSKLIFVEFSDPSCPYCHVAGGLNGSLNKQVGTQFVLKADGGTYVAPVLEMKKLVDEGKASFVWVYSYGHGNGELATEALYCAQEQGKFWAVNDLLMTDKGYTLLNNDVKNDRSKTSTLVSFLSSAIDSNFLSSCITSGKYTSRISSDQALSKTFGVSGTPGFFVNSSFFEGAYSFTDMQSTVDAALN